MDEDSEGTDCGTGGSTFAANAANAAIQCINSTTNGTHYFVSLPFLLSSNVANKPQRHNISATVCSLVYSAIVNEFVIVDHDKGFFFGI